MRTLPEIARAEKSSIVFYDEVDSLTRRREGSESSFDHRTKNQLSEFFDALARESGIFIIGATNRPWDIDPAFLSRFNRKI